MNTSALRRRVGAIFVLIFLCLHPVAQRTVSGDSVTLLRDSDVLKYMVVAARRSVEGEITRVDASIESEFELRKVEADKYELRVTKAELRATETWKQEETSTWVKPDDDPVVITFVQKEGGADFVRETQEGHAQQVAEGEKDARRLMTSHVIPMLFIDNAVDLEAIAEDGKEVRLSGGDETGANRFKSSPSPGPWRLVQRSAMLDGDLMQLMSYSYDEFEAQDEGNLLGRGIAFSRHIRSALVHKPTRLVLHGSLTRTHQRHIQLDNGQIKREYGWSRIDLVRVE